MSPSLVLTNHTRKSPEQKKNLDKLLGLSECLWLHQLPQPAARLHNFKAPQSVTQISAIIKAAEIK